MAPLLSNDKKSLIVLVQGQRNVELARQEVRAERRSPL